ncbi:hypothetical protein S101258_00149 [Lactiplantibacillus plantarum subsp. plantarum]|uniref:Uncharacterized protein n=1 Tax=Lactiplantibacillus plantarum subsp. plantarum TaxID=337330 RepID=A0A2S3U9V0_LACPN|nr:hypothetical protein S101258_00149 [Lactiplantibacillus plantarum subsp. plantarum]
MTTHIHWRKVTGLLLALLLSITLVGCSNKTSKTKYYDKDFITSLEQGLEARWKLTDEVGDQDINQSDYKSFINAELKQFPAILPKSSKVRSYKKTPLRTSIV